MTLDCLMFSSVQLTSNVSILAFFPHENYCLVHLSDWKMKGYVQNMMLILQCAYCALDCTFSSVILVSLRYHFRFLLIFINILNEIL